MVVVPDNATAKKFPSVEGMMVYRKDNNKVYVQGNKKLNALAEEKKVDKNTQSLLIFVQLLNYINIIDIITHLSIATIEFLCMSPLVLLFKRECNSYIRAMNVYKRAF